MTDVILERKFDPALTVEDVWQMAADSGGCFDIHRVQWNNSMHSSDGQRMCCWFSAADLESARLALRQMGEDTSLLWRGTVHTPPGIDEEDIAGANVLVERSFDSAVTLQEIQDIEDAGIHCLQTRNVRFIRTFFSADQKRMICLYSAPDAESVREAQRGAAVPFDDVWGFRMLGPNMPDGTST